MKNALTSPFFGKISKPLARLAEADMVFILLPVLMLLLVAGTLAQRWMGLFRAHEMFFSSFILWLGPVPLPGGFTVLAALSVCLTLKFLLKSDWSLRKSGIILSHLGALILLIGGLMTAITARESFMLIPEGQETPYIYAYNSRSLSIYEDGRERLRLPFADVENWDKAALPFTLSVLENCENCEIKKPEPPPEDARSMAQFMQLAPRPSEKEPEANLSGATLKISSTGSDQTDGTYLVFDGMPKPITFKKDNREYTLIFGKNQYELPFTLRLDDFKKDLYNGTDKARNYSSDVTLRDGKLSWPARIEMNKPLRYRGYTFFQSSFEEGPNGQQATILAVVENKGRLLPYIGTGVIGLGLLLHFMLAVTGRRRV